MSLNKGYLKYKVIDAAKRENYKEKEKNNKKNNWEKRKRKKTPMGLNHIWILFI